MGADPFSKYGVGLNNVGSYQVAGTPWITGSTTLPAGHEVGYDFPMVTKTFTVINRSNENVRVHFNSTGSGDIVNGLHFVELDSKNDSYTFNNKSKEIYISAPAGNSAAASFTITAELTQIESGRMYVLTGSGLTTVTRDAQKNH